MTGDARGGLSSNRNASDASGERENSPTLAECADLGLREKMAEEGRSLISRSENDYNKRVGPFRTSSQEYAITHSGNSCCDLAIRWARFFFLRYNALFFMVAHPWENVSAATWKATSRPAGHGSRNAMPDAQRPR